MAVTYDCPYCTESYKGGIGYHNLTEHMKKVHPEKMDEFNKMERNELENIIMDEPEDVDIKPKTKTILETLNDPVPVQQPPSTSIQEKMEKAQQRGQTFIPLQKAERHEDSNLPPYMDQMPPEEWIESFLKYYNCRPLFIRIQKDNVVMTNKLPTTSTLVNDLKQMDSGHNHLTTIQYIGNMYEERLRQYLQKQQQYQYLPREGVSPYNSYDYHQGRVSMPGYPGAPSPTPYNRAIPPLQTRDNDRIARLEDELRKREEQDRRNMEIKLMELQNKLEQAQYSHEDPQMKELRDEMKRIQEYNSGLQQQLQQQREENLMRRMEDIQRIALSNKGLSSEQIQNIVDARVKEERNTIDAKRELEQLLDQRLSQRAGTSEADVKMKQAELEYEINKAKLQAESEKTSMWGNTFKEVAGVLGEGIGKGLGQMGQQKAQQPPQQPPRHTVVPPPSEEAPEESADCPYGCGTQILLEPGITHGICPGCNGKIIIDALGKPHQYEETIPPPEMHRDEEKETSPSVSQEAPPQPSEQVLTPPQATYAPPSPPEPIPPERHESNNSPRPEQAPPPRIVINPPKQKEEIKQSEPKPEPKKEPPKPEKKEEPKGEQKKEKGITCEICGKHFDNAKQLRGHMIHHKKKK